MLCPRRVGIPHVAMPLYYRNKFYDVLIVCSGGIVMRPVPHGDWWRKRGAIFSAKEDFYSACFFYLLRAAYVSTPLHPRTLDHLGFIAPAYSNAQEACLSKSSPLFGENSPSGRVKSPVSLFPVISDRPVRGVFAMSLTENPEIGPVCVSGCFAREKTGLFRACLNRGSGGGMRFGLWKGVIRGPAVAVGGLAVFWVLRRRIGVI